MNRSRKDYIERWRRVLAGIALYGTTSEIKDGPLARASKILDIPDEVERFLGQQWDEDEALKQPPPARPEPGNGHQSGKSPGAK